MDFLTLALLKTGSQGALLRWVDFSVATLLIINKIGRKVYRSEMFKCGKYVIDYRTSINFVN